jgi:hypothetical protein
MVGLRFGESAEYVLFLNNGIISISSPACGECDELRVVP